MRKWIESHLIALLVMAITCAMPVYSTAQAPRYDLLLKGGHVIDPANNLDEIMDVAVSKNKIAAVEKDISASQAGKVVNASGLYVTPGLIDIHFHIGHGGPPLNWFTPEARAHTAPLGIPADLALQSGVTTVVDAGTSGAETFLQEKEEVIDHAKVRVLAFLNIVANGMNGGLTPNIAGYPQESGLLALVLSPCATGRPDT
jgi:dihydroorotase